MNFCYWCETEIQDAQGDFCGPCIEEDALFLTGASNAGKLWRELFG